MTCRTGVRELSSVGPSKQDNKRYSQERKVMSVQTNLFGFSELDDERRSWYFRCCQRFSESMPSEYFTGDPWTHLISQSEYVEIQMQLSTSLGWVEGTWIGLDGDPLPFGDPRLSQLRANYYRRLQHERPGAMISEEPELAFA
jgi:hypothetical protein